MTIIKRRPARTPIVRHICRLRQPNRDVLLAYAGFLGDSPDYVLNQVIETVLAKDREFLAWRGESTSETSGQRPAEHDSGAGNLRPSAYRASRP